MAGASSGSGSSSCDVVVVVDDFYFSALHDDDEIFPISDEKYAYQLQLQEALILSSSSSFTSSSSSSKNKQPITSSSLSVIESDDDSSSSYCGICTYTKKSSEMFHNSKACRHVYCSDCIRSHVAAKIRDNLTVVTCPHPDCKGVIGPEVCRSIVPQQVLERWESILCENVVIGSEKFYCPFKDCSAMLVKDGDAVGVTSSECPNCNRLFCAQCKVGWHSGIDCREFQSEKKGERNPEDLMLIDLAKNEKWMRCSKCRFYVEKTSGCLHITCRCGHHFCYMCGKAYDETHACAG